MGLLRGIFWITAAARNFPLVSKSRKITTFIYSREHCTMPSRSDRLTTPNQNSPWGRYGCLGSIWDSGHLYYRGGC